MAKYEIALFLAFASVLSGKTQAMNEPKSHQTLAAVGAASKNQNGGFVNWVKNHKWQLVAGTLTTATVVTLAALGIKYLIPKNKEEPKEELKNGELNKEKTREEPEKDGTKKEEPKKEEPKKEEPKKEELKEEEHEPKEKTKEELKKEEPKKEEAKKEEPKKEDSQEVDAVDYILCKANEKIERYISHELNGIDEKSIEAHKLQAQKVLKMIKSYFNKIRENNYQCTNHIGELIDYFNGTKKMQSKDIYLRCNTSYLLTILDFDKCSCYIEVAKCVSSSELNLKIIVVNECIRKKPAYKYRIPEDRAGEVKYLYEKDLLGE